MVCGEELRDGARGSGARGPEKAKRGTLRRAPQRHRGHREKREVQEFKVEELKIWRENEEGFLSAQADPFPTGSESSIAGSKRERKSVGLLRSK